MREEIALADLLPESYARYRPVLADSLRFFLERVSPVRLRRIFAEQIRMSAPASTTRRVVALLRHLPALHKLGQVVARDRRLNVKFRRRLQQLESLVPRTPVADVVRLLEREFKSWRKAGVRLGNEPLAEGSVAVVMPFVRRDSRGTEPREGVFKLLKCGIQEELGEDLEILGSLGDFLDQECERYHLPELGYRETFETIRDLLLHEVQLDGEQGYLAEAAEIYAPMQSVIIPTLFEFCTERLTAMERIRGNKIAGGKLPKGVSREATARVAAEALIARPIFSSRPAALFHADPHAGNLLVTAAGQVGIIDWSLVGHLGRRDRIEIVQLVLGALALDAGRMERAVGELARKGSDPTALREVLQSSLRELRWGTFPGIAWLTRLFDNLVMKARMRFDANLLLFRKSLLTLEGVLADLVRTGNDSGGGFLDEAMLAAFVQNWTAEWPERLQAPFNARSFSTHVSTADLFRLLWSGPATVARWWNTTGLELLEKMLSSGGRS